MVRTSNTLRFRSSLSCWGVILSAAYAAPCAAQAQARDPVAAQSLFDDAKRLMAEKDYAQACPKFAESQRLDPAGGTLIALGLCHEAWGKTASAWAEFNDALTQARLDGRADRERAALAHIAALEKRLIRVRVVVPGDAPADLGVERDGTPVGRAVWSTPIAVEPGAHTFAAHASNRRPYSTEIVLDKEGQTVDVVIPELEPSPPPATAPATPSPASAPVAAQPTTPPASTAPSAAPEGAPPARSSQTTWAWVAGGVGVGAVAVGSIFGASALSKWRAADKACPGGTCRSTADRDQGVQAGHAADVSTVLFVVGGAALASSVVLFLTAPHGDAQSEPVSALKVSPWLSRESAGLGVSGAL